MEIVLHLFASIEYSNIKGGKRNLTAAIEDYVLTFYGLIHVHGTFKFSFKTVSHGFDIYIFYCAG